MRIDWRIFNHGGYRHLPAIVKFKDFANGTIAKLNTFAHGRLFSKITFGHLPGDHYRIDGSKRIWIPLDHLEAKHFQNGGVGIISRCLPWITTVRIHYPGSKRRKAPYLNIGEKLPELSSQHWTSGRPALPVNPVNIFMVVKRGFITQFSTDMDRDDQSSSNANGKAQDI